MLGLFVRDYGVIELILKAKQPQNNKSKWDNFTKLHQSVAFA